MPVRLRPADPALVGPALARFRAGAADRDDLRLLTKHLLALLVARAPGGAVEVRVPPYAAAQCLAGHPAHPRHARRPPWRWTPPTWIALGGRRPGLGRGRARRPAAGVGGALGPRATCCRSLDRRLSPARHARP